VYYLSFFRIEALTGIDIKIINATAGKFVQSSQTQREASRYLDKDLNLLIQRLMVY
jgi:hypothetical protein